MLRHIYRTFLFGVLFPLTLIAITPAAVSQESGAEPGALKVVYHADFKDPRRFSAMLTSIYNMASTYEDDLADYDIRIVFVAHGIRFLTDDPLEDTPFVTDAALMDRRENLRGRLRALHSTKGVKIELCEITRSQINLPKDKLYKMVDLVQSGVVRIAELQRKGFAYLKIE